ncbi:saxitoxin and tetrodotoxin-binding protein 2 [Hypomesus transpacificus]|uniref:saxitoxin and tetrodotoxin-binding protein 2 n=1 Tax=Hypomesus transpacificus TaxID=137520 RepID=UPI001F07CA33|nr:saxitoxin and tetrodotoxin-binding protein 2 [Hypomesus transpacificus]
MRVLCGAVLLAVLVACGETAPTPEECKDMVKPLEASEFFKISGRWILLEAYCDDKTAGETLLETNSTWSNFPPVADNKTFLLQQGIMREETCVLYSVNMTAVNNTLLVNNGNDTNIASFLQTCPECLIIHDNVTSRGKLVQYLLVYGKTSKLPVSVLETIRKQAECLKFQQPPQFSYDGVAELCPQKTEDKDRMDK